MGTLVEIFPAVTAGVIGVELLVQVLGVVVVDQHERLADGEVNIQSVTRRDGVAGGLVASGGVVCSGGCG